jgi:hypothetical protein
MAALSPGSPVRAAAVTAAICSLSPDSPVWSARHLSYPLPTSKQDIHEVEDPAVTTDDQTPPTPQPGPDAGIDDIQTAKEDARNGLGEAVEDALPAQADITGPAEQRLAGVKDRITENAHKTTAAAVEKAHAAQSTARKGLTGIVGLVKPHVSIVALTAAAVVIGVVVWRRR